MLKKPKKLKLRPYARLLTMLGDQLIRNERVALVELIKNAYDADASWVKVTFEGFDEHFSPSTNAKIIIEDDGHGMTEDIIVNHWANPATPVKAIGKKTRMTTAKGRVIQGEKGIGRFALFKLGRQIKIVTRPKRESIEHTLELDVSKYDQDFLGTGKKALFLDDLYISLRSTAPAVIVPHKISLGAVTRSRASQGTRIEVSHLTGRWNKRRVEEVYEDLARLQSSFALRPTDSDPKNDLAPFELYIYRGTRHETFKQDQQERLAALMRENAVLKVEGSYHEPDMTFRFTIGKRRFELPLADPQLSGLRVYRDNYYDEDKHDALEDRGTECGSFTFQFYVFDFRPDAKKKFLLDKSDKDLIADHRIYLYRDGIRVYPYGDPDDDWLQIDVRRGTVRAAEFVSNDQVVGFVSITQENNPQLRDKTSREGLVDTGNPTHDFVALLQIFLAWVRSKPYAEYLAKGKDQKDIEVFKTEVVKRTFDEILKTENLPAPAREKVVEAERAYQQERRYLVHRAETTEHLAGVGLSVEAASHDLMLAMSTASRTLHTLMSQIQRPGDLDREHLHRELATISGVIAFITDQLRDMQLLFRSTKQKRRLIRVDETLERVVRLFEGIARKSEVTISVESVGSPLQVKTTDAVLLQLFLNLFDNAVYWLAYAKARKQILIRLNGDDQTLVFADSGPGISATDEPYIFDPFYSGKGEEGRGLGLYIARQLLERHDYTIELAPPDERVLEGANFLISFVAGDQG